MVFLIMYAAIALPELPKSQLILDFLSDLLVRRNLCIAASRASGLVSGIGFIMMKLKMQFSVSSVLLH